MDITLPAMILCVSSVVELLSCIGLRANAAAEMQVPTYRITTTKNWPVSFATIW